MPSRFAVALLAFFLLLAGCDYGGDSDSLENPAGVWREIVEAEEFISYAVTGESAVNFYTEGRYRGTCWVIAGWTIMERDGSGHILEGESGGQSKFTIVRDGNRLTIEDFEYADASRTASEVRSALSALPAIAGLTVSSLPFT